MQGPHRVEPNGDACNSPHPVGSGDLAAMAGVRVQEGGMRATEPGRVAAEGLSGQGVGWLQTAVLARALRDRADLLPGRHLGRTHALGDEAADPLLAPGRRDNASVRRERLADA